MKEYQVQFKKPYIIGLNKQGYTCVDMHCHTRYSDGFATIEDIEKKAQKMGIGVAIADHNEIKGSLKICKNKKIFSIPAIELGVKEGVHILLYFYDVKDLKQFYGKHVKNNKMKNHVALTNIPFAELLDITRDYNCCVDAAHPYGMAMFGFVDLIDIASRKYMKRLDFIEAINGQNLRNYNIKAGNLAKELKLPITGGTDTHVITQLGGVVTCANKDSFLDDIKKKKNMVVGQEISTLHKAYVVMHKTKNWVSRPKEYVPLAKSAVKKIMKKGN